MTVAVAVTEPRMEGAAGVIDGKLVLSQGISRVLNAGGVSGQFDRIPVIDLTPLVSKDATPEDMEKLVEELRDACMRVGFFVIKNHGIDWAVVERAFAGSREFFSLPLETKLKVHQSLSKSFMGYEEPYYTNVDRLKKGGKLGRLPSSDLENDELTEKCRPEGVDDYRLRAGARHRRSGISAQDSPP